jgi:hypothetical protein
MGKTNSDVAHAWAHQIGTSAYTSNRNMFFEGDTVYSYGRHFPIAKHVGRGTVLFTEDAYSNTTAKHKHEVLLACSHMNRIYVPEVGLSHARCFEKWLDQIDYIKNYELSRARKPEIYINKIQKVVQRAQKYAEFFEIELPSELANIDYTVSEEQIAAIKERAKEERRRKAEQERIKIEKWMEGKSYGSLNTKYQYLRVNGDRIETSKNVRIPLELAKRFYERIKNGMLKAGDSILYYRVDSIGDTIKIGCHTFKKQYLLDFGATL